MKRTLDFQFLLEYAKHNWFKLGIVFFLLLMFLQKDMSFQLNLHTPSEESIPSQQQMPLKKPSTKQKPPQSAITEVVVAKPKIKVDELGMAKGIANTFKTTKPTNQLHKVSEQTKKSYLKRFAKVAVSEQQKFGIPASIILANAMFHSYAGTRNMSSTEGNNHFAIPCTDGWTDSRGTYEGICYRHFDNAWMSFRNHSTYITTGRFDALKGLGRTNYKAWAKELEKKGYSDFDKLADNLIKLVDEYSLHQLDQ